jgi:hypothetical protein
VEMRGRSPSTIARAPSVSIGVRESLLDDPLGALAELLEEAGIEYALIGGHAVNAWVEPRFTADIDVTIEAGVAQMERLTAVL